VAKQEGKKIDESWKAQVQAEKEASAAKAAEQARQAGQKEAAEAETKTEREEAAQGAPPPPNFSLFVHSLTVEGLVYLGAAPNPATGKAETNLPQAKYIIGLLEIIEEKTRGNLTDEEDKLLKAALTDLRMRYVKLGT